jgi:hypothetical protein
VSLVVTRMYKRPNQEEPEKREEREGAFDVLLFEEQWVTEKYPAFKIKNGEDYLKHMRIPKQMYGGHYELLTLAKLFKGPDTFWLHTLVVLHSLI